jgi:hypothetical protein
VTGPVEFHHTDLTDVPCRALFPIRVAAGLESSTRHHQNRSLRNSCEARIRTSSSPSIDARARRPPRGPDHKQTQTIK